MENKIFFNIYLSRPILSRVDTKNFDLALAAWKARKMLSGREDLTVLYST